MDDRQAYLVEEQKMNEGRLHHISDTMMSIIKFYFVTAFSVIAAVSVSYYYGIMKDLSHLVVWYLLMPLLVFGFTAYFSLKKLQSEYDYWIRLRNEIGSQLLTDEIDKFHPIFSHALRPFMVLMGLILTGNFFVFVVLAFPSIAQGYRWQWGVALFSGGLVTVVIGLLSTLSVLALNSARQKSRDSKRISDVKQIQTALELFYADHGCYPKHGTDDVPFAVGQSKHGMSLTSNGFSERGVIQNDSTIYMGIVPSNPEPGGAPYLYIGNGSDYKLTFAMEGPMGNLSGGAHTATPNGIL
jgi:type II secretory pathway pseudopilin PulG